MKFTLSWLKDHLETDASLETIVDTLTMIGLEVESVDDGAALKPFIIAEVLDAKPHPDADRLQVLTVSTGKGEPVQVVCGASNARAGMRGVFASPGSYVPGIDTTLSVGKIRGVESRGMMVSERELEISDEHEGIIDLPQDAPVGTTYAEWADLTDPVIEIGLTPNRPDCTGVHGIARDLAAAGIGTLKDDTIKPVKGDGPCPVSVSFEFGDTPSLCKAFGLRLVRNVKNDPSPEWMQKRLRAIGLRPINALVDITNYITFDRGRPLHVFDADKVQGNLVVRRAKDGETFKGLDEKDYTLESSMCVIADDKGVESLAGIMGGLDTGCDENTTHVLIESALWDETNIATTGRKTGIITDARYRFERGVDPAFMLGGLDLATQMVLDLCGGEATESTIAGSVPETEKIIEFPLSEVKRLSGIEVSVAEIKAVLKELGFWVAGSGDIVKVAVPSWRPDVHGKADLVEEVMRIVGVDKVPLVPSLGREVVVRTILTPIQIRTRRAKRLLAGRGMVEAVTWSFVDEKAAKYFGGGQPSLKLANPISSDLSDMRPSLLPGLLQAAQKNADRGYGDVALFEVGQIFAGDQPEDQTISASGIRRGTATFEGSGRHWSRTLETVDAFDAKADALSVLADLGMDADKVQISRDAPSWYHPGRSGALRLGPKVLGYFGELHPATLEAMDVKGVYAAFEITLDNVPQPRKKATRAKPALVLSDLMPVRRDFAFIVHSDVESGQLVRAAKGADKQLIQEVTLFDMYEGDRLDAAKKSIAIDVTLQPTQKTLTDEDLEAVSSKIVAAVEKATGGTLRAS
jgi:phenylalanyl-tRNA synthetase beta chain